MTAKTKVAVLMGGDSGEREVSLASGRAVAGAIDRALHDVVCIAWNGALPSRQGRDQVAGVPVIHVGSSQLLETLLAEQCDVTFIALHGGSGDVAGFKAVVDWLAGRIDGFTSADGQTAVHNDWGNGKNAMIGKSYDGTFANGVASTGVDNLTTIVPISAISSWYDYSRMGGIR